MNGHLCHKIYSEPSPTPTPTIKYTGVEIAHLVQGPFSSCVWLTESNAMVLSHTICQTQECQLSSKHNRSWSPLWLSLTGNASWPCQDCQKRECSEVSHQQQDHWTNQAGRLTENVVYGGLYEVVFSICAWALSIVMNCFDEAIDASDEVFSCCLGSR